MNLMSCQFCSAACERERERKKRRKRITKNISEIVSQMTHRTFAARELESENKAKRMYLGRIKIKLNQVYVVQNEAKITKIKVQNIELDRT